MLDIANNFAGTLMGIINALGRITLADLLKNIITFHFFVDDNDVYEYCD